MCLVVLGTRKITSLNKLARICVWTKASCEPCGKRCGTLTVPSGIGEEEDIQRRERAEAACTYLA